MVSVQLVTCSGDFCRLPTHSSPLPPQTPISAAHRPVAPPELRSSTMETAWWPGLALSAPGLGKALGGHWFSLDVGLLAWGLGSEHSTQLSVGL